MNLTKLCVAGLCLSAMTASAVLPQEDAFEGGIYSGNWSGNLLDLTYGADVVDGDAYPSYSGARPMSGVTSNRVLKLDTEGGVWTNTVTDGSFAGTTNVFVDMLVKFVPSEELPSIGTDVKLAVAVLAGTPNKLAISVIDTVGNTNAWTVTEGAIDTNVWCRLTVNMYSDSNEDSWAIVKTNGSEVNASPYYINAADRNLNSVGFQGTGYIDEVVVRNDDPISTAVLLTLSFTAGTDIASVLVGGNPKNSGDTVPSGSELVITAALWKEIDNVTGPSTVTWDSGARSNSTATVTVANATSTTVEITAQNETSTTPIGGSSLYQNEPADKVAAWGRLFTVPSMSDLYYNQYLFNIDELATVPTLRITSITVSGSTVTIKVTADGTNLAAINGTLSLISYATLGGTPHPQTVTFVSGTTEATISCDIGTDKFVRATVE